ncbi:hypothetical protein [Schaedlerella arabinosiphila]|uniref:hypothetical protein n=1 Tax=Schaedlerella arabinosiphila TaxID=2044587 RepID=UPI00138FEB7D|nr:hypothetical protein [Schaedlerella arabinosiphila]
MIICQKIFQFAGKQQKSNTIFRKSSKIILAHRKYFFKTFWGINHGFFPSPGIPERLDLMAFPALSAIRKGERKWGKTAVNAAQIPKKQL